MGLLPGKRIAPGVEDKGIAPGACGKGVNPYPSHATPPSPLPIALFLGWDEGAITTTTGPASNGVDAGKSAQTTSKAPQKPPDKRTPHYDLRVPKGG